MLGKTHAAVGAAAALYVVYPDTIEGVVFTAAAGIAGGLLCDIDSPKTAIHQKAILLLTGVIAVIAIAFLNGKTAGDIAQAGAWLISESADPRAFYGAILLLLCIVAAFTKHRTFSHSIVFALSVWFLMSRAFEPAAVPLTAGVVSHIVLDLLNEHGIQLFWPFSSKLRFKLCSSKGAVNSFLFYLGIGASFLLAAESLGIFTRAQLF